MSVLTYWFAVAIVFLIVEMATATFYGLSISLAALLTAIYVLVSNEGSLTILQGVILAVASAVFAYFLPKYLVSGTPDAPQGMDRYIGETRKVKKVSDTLKITLDGVDYPIAAEDDVVAGDRVEVLGHRGVTLQVKKV